MKRSTVVWIALTSNIVILLIGLLYVGLRWNDVLRAFEGSSSFSVASARSESGDTGESSGEMIISPSESAEPETSRRRPGLRRPPTRRQLPSAAAETPRAEARYVGPWVGSGPLDPPPPELYPFSVEKRTFPAEGIVEVEFRIKNGSGSYWESAELIFKSQSDYLPAQQFVLEDWGIDEVASVRYRFPEEEIGERLDHLRVVRVAGAPRYSVLTGGLADTRREVAEKIGSESAAGAGTRGTAVSHGLMGVWAAAATSLQNVSTPARTIPTPAPHKGRKIILPNVEMIADQLPDVLTATTEDSTKALVLLKRSHAAALQVQDGIVRLVENINDNGYEQSLAGDGKEILKEIQGASATFDEVGLELLQFIQNSPDAELPKLSRQLDQMADTILELMESVEAQVKVLDPQFTIQEV